MISMPTPSATLDRGFPWRRGDPSSLNRTAAFSAPDDCWINYFVVGIETAMPKALVGLCAAALGIVLGSGGPSAGAVAAPPAAPAVPAGGGPRTAVTLEEA